MASSMLAMPYMTILLDQAKTRYTITDKSTGAVIGFAFMLVEDKVTPDHIQLLLWHAHGNDHGKEQVQQQPPNRGVDECTSIQEGLASDLDISEDSSVNEDTRANNALSGKLNLDAGKSLNSDSNSNIIQSSTGEGYVNEGKVVKSDVNHASKVSISKVSNHLSDTMARPPSVPTCMSVTQSIAAQIASQLMGTVDEDITNDVSTEEKSCKDSEDKLRKAVLSTKRKLEAGTIHKEFGKYTKFYTDVGVEQIKKHKQVRCLLCTGERILAYGNFGDHLKAFHEPRVKCTICGVEYSGAGIKRHRKKCIAKTNSNSLEVEESVMDADIVHTTDSPEPKQVPITALWPVFLRSQLAVAAKTCIPGAGAEGESNTNLDGIKDDITTSLGSMLEGNVLSGEKVESKEEDKLTFILSSASVEGVCIKIRLKKGAKIKKAMKKFGKKFNISRKELKFMLGGELLSGEELVDGLEGREIVVAGKFN